MFPSLGSTFGPRLVDGRFLAELLGQVVESLQPADLVEKPLLVALLRPLQVAPGIVDVLHGAELRTSTPSPLSSKTLALTHFDKRIFTHLFSVLTAFKPTA